MRAWLIVNPSSGSVTEALSVQAVEERPDLSIVGSTIFPDDPLPTPDALSVAGADLVILFAGDGTINAAACALDGWTGTALILPGGTMNMLARRLHGQAGPAAILDAALADPPPERVSIPFVEAGPNRAFVALIAGPPSAWAHAREAVRKGRLSAAWRAARIAWLRSFAGGVRLRPGPRGRRHRAVAVLPDDEGMEVAAIDIDGWLQALRLGADWLGGDWRSSPHVALSRPAEAMLDSRRPIQLLFDGEAVKLPGPLRVVPGMSKLRFIRTLAPGRAGGRA